MTSQSSEQPESKFQNGSHFSSVGNGHSPLPLWRFPRRTGTERIRWAIVKGLYQVSFEQPKGWQEGWKISAPCLHWRATPGTESRKGHPELLQAQHWKSCHRGRFMKCQADHMSPSRWLYYRGSQMNTSWHTFPTQLNKLWDETEHLLPLPSPSRAKILNHITNNHLENAFSDPLNQVHKTQ